MKKLDNEKLNQIAAILRPFRPAFFTSLDEDGGTHLAPFAWYTVCSANPPMVIVALQNERGKKLSASLINIRRQGEFAINLPRKGQEEKLVQASFLPPETGDKFDRSEFTRKSGSKISVPLILESVACVECRIREIIDQGGDHDLLIADVLAVWYDETCYDKNLHLLPTAGAMFNMWEERYPDYQYHCFAHLGEPFYFSVYYDK